jgi:DNA-binding SARP family transcriptional activator
LRISIFGSLSVTTDDRVLGPRDFSGVKPKQVLEILAIEREHAVTKGRLAEYLWGEEPPRNHLATLESYVSVLRQTLQPGVRARESVISTEHGGYRLDTERVSVDLDEFDRAVAATAGKEPHVALAGLAEALAMVRGSVLEDEPYADWARDIRSMYEQRHVQALIDAGRLCLLTGDSGSAVSYAEKAAALNPLAEPAYQVLMTAYYSTWRQDDALAAYNRCRRLLGEELGVDPLDETVALHLAILRHEDVAVLLPGDQAAPPSSAPRVEPEELPLLGREDEIARIRAAADAAHAGRFTIVMITGEPGIGKTRLLDTITSALPPPLACNRCSDLESGLPYLAISLALRPVLDQTGESMPVLDDLLQRAEAAQPFDGFARMRVLEQLARLVSSVGKLVICLDDAHWADPETIGALTYLRRRNPDAPVVVLLTANRVGLGNEALRNLQPDLRIDLGILAEEDVTPFGESLYSVTGGHPLFIADWLRARARGLQETFSPQIRERVVTAIWDLGPQAFRLATVATVLSQPFTIMSLAALVDAHMDEIAEELDRLTDHGLFRADAHGYRFRHVPVREILLDTLSPARRFLLQQKAAYAEETPRRRKTDRQPEPAASAAGGRREDGNRDGNRASDRRAGDRRAGDGYGSGDATPIPRPWPLLN